MTMCATVMAKNANAKEMVWITTELWMPTRQKNGVTIRARNGSPSQPSARLESVTPNWQAER